MRRTVILLALALAVATAVVAVHWTRTAGPAVGPGDPSGPSAARSETEDSVGTPAVTTAPVRPRKTGREGPARVAVRRAPARMRRNP